VCCKKAVTMGLSESDTESKYCFFLERCDTPPELKPYLKARRIAALHYERKQNACDKWTSIAHEHLVEILDQDPAIEIYLDGHFDPSDDSFEGLPRAFKRINKKLFLAQ
jgi:hypothetical protein